MTLAKKSRKKKAPRKPKKKYRPAKADDKRIGNNFYLLRHKSGADMLFSDAAQLKAACYEYIQLVEQSPLYEADGYIHKGKSKIAQLPKMRLITMSGLCLYLGCTDSYFRSFKSTADTEKKKDFLTVIEEIEMIIYNYKLTGAASGFFKENIISRDLGLRDGRDHTTKGEKLQSPTASVGIIDPHEKAE